MAKNFTPLQVIEAVRRVKESVDGRHDARHVPEGKDVVSWINDVRLELGCCPLQSLPQGFSELHAKASASKTKVYSLNDTFELMLGYAEMAWGANRSVVSVQQRS